MAYAYQVRFRCTPDNGAEEIFSLSAFTPTGGPVATMPSYEIEKVTRANPDRVINERRFGFRPTVRMKFDFPNLADEDTLVKIVNYTMRDDAHVFLSLDGGATEREVVLDSAYDRAPLGGKVLAGVETSLAFRAVGLAPEIPALGSGTW